MTEKDEFRVHFGIYDFSMKHEELTDLLGVQPDAVEKKGELVKVGQGSVAVTITARADAWVLYSGGSKTDSLSDHLTSLKKKLEAVAAKISSVPDGFTAELSIGVYSVDANIGLNIDQSMIQILAKLGASLDVDIYSLSDPDAIG